MAGCTLCKGRGQRPCDDCWGDAGIDCPTCSGRGYLQEGVPCQACAGEGVVDCPLCGGKGTIPCFFCNGTGEVP